MRDEALLADVASAVAEPGLHVWWLGQSGFLVSCEGRRALLDPYLSDALTRKYAATDKPHVRMTARCVAPERLTGLSLVTASHVHTDHLDGETLRAVAMANGGMDLVLPHPIEEEARVRLGEAPARLHGLDAGETLQINGWEVTGIPAAHNDLKRDEAGRCHYLGFVIRRGGFALYHSGDTLWHEGLVQALEAEGRMDVMLLPINGNVPERRVAGNLDGAEAAALAKQGGARLVVPCHYDLFEFNTVSPELFVRECERLEQPYRVLRCGERVSLSRAGVSGQEKG